MAAAPTKKRKPKRITASYLHNAGLAYLQKFAASRAGFRRMLMRRVKASCHFHTDQNAESCAAMVDETVQKFERAGLLNDQVYAQGMVASQRRIGRSQRAIAARLAEKGIDRELTAAVLAAHDSNDLDAALIFAKRKKLGPFGKSDSQKALAAFGRAGFSYDVARKILGAEAEDI